MAVNAESFFSLAVESVKALLSAVYPAVLTDHSHSSPIKPKECGVPVDVPASGFFGFVIAVELLVQPLKLHPPTDHRMARHSAETPLTSAGALGKQRDMWGSFGVLTNMWDIYPWCVSLARRFVSWTSSTRRPEVICS